MKSIFKLIVKVNHGESEQYRKKRKLNTERFAKICLKDQRIV